MFSSFLTAVLLGRVSARLRFLPVPKNGSKNLYQIFKVERSIRNITGKLCEICAKHPPGTPGFVEEQKLAFAPR